VAASSAERRILRQIEILRGLPSRELSALQDRMVYHSYQAGEVIWRARGPLGITGYVQSGEVDLEYRVAGTPVRTTRLCAGDPLPSGTRGDPNRNDTLIARAVTHVRLGILPDVQPGTQSLAKPGRSHPAVGTLHGTGRGWVLPVLLLLLFVGLGWGDLTRIASGLIYLASSQEQETASMDLLKTAERVDGKAAFAYNEEGYRWFQQARLPEAEAAFVQALDRDPSNAPALNNLAIASFTRGDLPQAASYLGQVTDRNPDVAIARYNLGVLMMHLDDPSAAIREFREASFIDPAAAPPMLQQAYLYNKIGDYGNAEQRARAAVKLDPSLPYSHLMLGIVLYNQGKASDALAPIADSLAIDPENRVARFYQALILGHLGQFGAALPILHDLLATTSDSGEAARILVEIDAIYRFQSEAKAVGQ
jgi:tetratricopeptide (TPR) repeat protein